LVEKIARQLVGGNDQEILKDYSQLAIQIRVISHQETFNDSTRARSSLRESISPFTTLPTNKENFKLRLPNIQPGNL
jgi:hypothetical protein